MFIGACIMIGLWFFLVGVALVEDRCHFFRTWYQVHQHKREVAKVEKYLLDLQLEKQRRAESISTGLNYLEQLHLEAQKRKVLDQARRILRDQ